MPDHRLTNVDLPQRTALCAVCGPTTIYVSQNAGKLMRMCVTKHRELTRNAYAKRLAAYREMHPLQKRGRKPGPPKPPREPRLRTYGSQAHVLSDVDDENKTAVCSQCGPVKIYISRHSGGNYITRRCSKANSQNVQAATEVRQSANRIFIDQYKVECGCQRCGYKENPRGLDLHHRNPAEKDLEMSKASKYSRERLLQEIAKCDVLCAICHRLVHEELRYA